MHAHDSALGNAYRLAAQPPPQAGPGAHHQAPRPRPDTHDQAPDARSSLIMTIPLSSYLGTTVVDDEGKKAGIGGGLAVVVVLMGLSA